MSAAKGFPTSDKIVTLNQSGIKNDYNTLQPTGSKRVSIDTVNRGVAEVTAGLIVAAGSGNVPGGAPQIITTLPHGAIEGNLIRFTSGALNGQEVSITKIVNPTTLEVGMYLPTGLAGSLFTLFSYFTPTYDPTTGAPAGGATEANQLLILAELEKMAPDIVLTSFLDYAVTNLTNAGWTQLIADTGATPIAQVQIFDSAGYTIELGVGAVGAEVRKLLINPGGNSLIPVEIPINSRISLRPINQPLINVGESVINWMG